MRVSYTEEESYPGEFFLWQANCGRVIVRSMAGVRLQDP